MSKTRLTTDQVLTMLSGAPARIAEATQGLTPDQVRAAPGPGEWSATEVLAHLRACADVWGGGIATILAGDQPALRAIDPRTWVEQTDYRDLAFHDSLQAYAAQRAGLMTTLTSLPPDAWDRSITVTGAGKPLQRTVFSFAHRLAIHERPHLKQIARAAAALRAE